MRFAVFAALFVAACGVGAPHEYPAQARARFEQSCPADSAVCTCTWDRITRAMSYEEYETALTRFRTDGLMDPRVARARAACIERHPEG